MTNQKTRIEAFKRLAPIELRELAGLWAGRGVPSGHQFDGVLENLGWFGKRFRQDMKADALLFHGGDRRLVAVDPKWIPLRLALRWHAFGRTQAAQNLFSYLQGQMRAMGPVAELRTVAFGGVMSAAMVYDRQPIIDHFRRIDDGKIMGAMTVAGEDLIYFFELERVEGP
ncbi:DUF4334 domain-containing protein [Rhizobium sp. TRM95796]|uniref:DUF4334 domain-containing protein n=1 Tax=Rhizobium sp. TRM95796 TaxID=2979862 RepID=UPI0021E7213D|nr:DUF4334 domain-containing protein [Rhizobium sp. TRM95796]MCV3769003.1 DUF4334 domain-containing protein [Rhizobium sp. TRM95796]